jgi:HK97 family phage major capsid protein
VDSITDEIKGFLGKARDIAEKADAENRDFTDTERAEVTDLMKKAAESKKKLDRSKADAATRQAMTDLGTSVGMFEDTKSEKRTASGLIVPNGRKSIGEYFVESAGYKGLLDSAPNGQFGEKMRVQSSPVGYKALLPGATPSTKDLVTSGGDGGSADAFVWPQFMPGLQVGLEGFERPLLLRSLVTGGQTTTDTIEYAKLVSITNNAAPVPEATTDGAIGSGTPAVTEAQAGVKPQSGFTTVRETTNVRTIAHWIPVTKRALSDAAQVQTLIDAFLEYGLEEELENQMVAGDGTGENLLGLNHISGTQNQAAVTDPANRPAGFGNLLALRRAKTKVRLVARSVANGYVVHPTDWQAVEELSDNYGRFYGDGPFGTGNMPTLWGLPVVESESVTPGYAWCADWRRAILWDRQQAALSVTDSHADFFVRNLVAILAELRAAFAVLHPTAFVRVALNAVA